MGRMARLQFNLRQMLVALPAVALVLLVGRWAIHSRSIAVGLAAFGLAGLLLIVCNFVVYLIVRGAGAAYGLDHADIPGERRDSRLAD
jgi:hypothetical protein